MFNLYYTGIDGNKKFSISYNILNKKWLPSSKEGKKIYLIPSDLCFIKIDDAFSSKLNELYSFYSLENEKKFGSLPFDISVADGKVYFAVYKDFPSEKYQHIELEPFAISRVFSLLSKEGFAVDIGRRKTTFVKVENGLLKSYRVILKGGDYLNSLVIRAKGITHEEAEKIKIEKGLEVPEIREGFLDILKQSCYELESSPVLLSGGGAYLKGINELFQNSINNNYCKAELTSAFGSSLKFALKNNYPNFIKKTITKDDIKKTALSVALISLSFAVSLALINKIYSVDDLKEAQKREFKKIFPNTPAISIQEQLKSKLSKGEKFELTHKLSNLGDLLTDGMTITSIEYSDGVLKVKGEANEKSFPNIKTKSLKQTVKGSLEFELEIK